MTRRTWTDDQLRVLVSPSKTWSGVLRGLGLSVRGRNHLRITQRVRGLGLDTSHFSRTRAGARDDELREAVVSSTSFEAVMQKMGVEPSRENREALQFALATLGC